MPMQRRVMTLSYLHLSFHFVNFFVFFFPFLSFLFSGGTNFLIAWAFLVVLSFFVLAPFFLQSFHRSTILSILSGVANLDCYVLSRILSTYSYLLFSFGQGVPYWRVFYWRLVVNLFFFGAMYVLYCGWTLSLEIPVLSFLFFFLSFFFFGGSRTTLSDLMPMAFSTECM